MPGIPVNGIDLYYELHGPAEGPVLVLNNGILMNAAASWVFQTRALSRHCRLLQYDCRGQGQSDHPDSPYSMALHADDLDGLLSALNIPRAHLLGISYGGEVALTFALNYPGRVQSLILADTASEIGPELRLIVEGWLACARSGDADAFFQATVPWNFSPEFIAGNPGILAEARRRYRQLDLPAVARLAESFLGLNLTDRLAAIRKPACILVGERDLLKGRPYAEILHRGIRGSELHILPGAGHASCWERPEAFNTIVLGFLAKQVG